MFLIIISNIISKTLTVGVSQPVVNAAGQALVKF